MAIAPSQELHGVEAVPADRNAQHAEHQPDGDSRVKIVEARVRASRLHFFINNPASLPDASRDCLAL
jgi:hypothetical protein